MKNWLKKRGIQSLDSDFIVFPSSFFEQLEKLTAGGWDRFILELSMADLRCILTKMEGDQCVFVVIEDLFLLNNRNSRSFTAA